MKIKTMGVLVVSLLLMGGHVAAARDTFDTANLRGRYTGHLNVGANFSDGNSTVRLDVQLLSALTFDGKGEVAGSSRVTASVPGQAPFTCPLAATGTYQLDEDGLGTATLALAAAPGEICGDGGGVTLQVNLVVGGHNRSRLDMTIASAVDAQGESLPLVGAGTLTK